MIREGDRVAIYGGEERGHLTVGRLAACLGPGYEEARGVDARIGTAIPLISPTSSRRSLIMQITLGVRGTGASDDASRALPRTPSGVRPWTPEELLHGKQFVLSKQFVQPQLVDGKSVSLPSPVRRPTTLGALVKSMPRRVCHLSSCRPRHAPLCTWSSSR